MNKVFLNVDENATSAELERVIKYNIGRANILRDSIKDLDKAEKLKESLLADKDNSKVSSKLDSEEEQEEQEEYLYYYQILKNELSKCRTNEELTDTVLNNLPSCENKKYSSLVNRIKLEILKEIHELDAMLEDEDVKNDAELSEEILSEKANLYEIISIIEYVQTKGQENKIEESLITENRLIFLETPSGSIYAENDLYSIPEEYYEVFKNLLLSIKDGTFKNAKMFNSAHQTLGGMSEVKDFKTRIVFDRIGKDTYVIISIFTKKCDMDNSYRESLSNRVSYYKKNRDYLVEMLQDNEFIEKNKSIETELLKGLETKNLVKTVKGGSKYDK